jgi:hypothetical protein
MATLVLDTYTEIKKRIKTAKDKGYWFYNVNNEIWLTPEEWQNECESEIISGWSKEHNPLIRYTMNDPRLGIQKRMKKMVAASMDLQKFTEKVLKYFGTK